MFEYDFVELCKAGFTSVCEGGNSCLLGMVVTVYTEVNEYVKVD